MSLYDCSTYITTEISRCLMGLATFFLNLPGVSEPSHLSNYQHQGNAAIGTSGHSSAADVYLTFPVLKGIQRNWKYLLWSFTPQLTAPDKNV